MSYDPSARMALHVFQIPMYASITYGDKTLMHMFHRCLMILPAVPLGDNNEGHQQPEASLIGMLDSIPTRGVLLA
jgi:hypothetical protein